MFYIWYNTKLSDVIIVPNLILIKSYSENYTYSFYSENVTRYFLMLKNHSVARSVSNRCLWKPTKFGSLFSAQYFKNKTMKQIG